MDFYKNIILFQKVIVKISGEIDKLKINQKKIFVYGIWKES